MLRWDSGGRVIGILADSLLAQIRKPDLHGIPIMGVNEFLAHAGDRRDDK